MDLVVLDPGVIAGCAPVEDHQTRNEVAPEAGRRSGSLDVGHADNKSVARHRLVAESIDRVHHVDVGLELVVEGDGERERAQDRERDTVSVGLVEENVRLVRRW